MTLPTQNESFYLALEYFVDGKEHVRKDIIDAAENMPGLTPEERAEKTSSGISVVRSRFGWTVSWLNQAGCLERTERGVYRITDKGRKALEREWAPDEFAAWLKTEIDTHNPWNVGSDKAKQEGEGKAIPIEIKPQPVSDASPMEQLDALVDTLNDNLEAELLQMILDHDENFFERLVVDLLEKMGYGRGKVTQSTNDGGIDGIITTDELGFSPIMTQAKRYDKGVVGRPDIQAFAGAIGSCTRGVFITTGRFAQTARVFADNYPHATLVLIDGKKLAQLMVKYNLGVSTERTYEIKRIDTDYFEE